VKLSNNGTAISPPSGYTGALPSIFGIALDASGDIWTANYGASSISELSSSGALLSPSTGYEIPTSAAQYPDAIAVDGANNVWVAEVAGTSVVEYAPSGSLISSSLGYGTGSIRNPAGVAVDGSGNVWIANANEGVITELVGAAAPVVTPLSAGVRNNALGTRP